MEKTPQKVRRYLIALKEERKLSWAELSERTGLPDSTIRKIFSGNTPDPRLETISQIVFAMNGSLDDMLADSEPAAAPLPVKTQPADSWLVAKDALEEEDQARPNEKEAALQQYNTSLKRDKAILFVLACILTTILVAFFFADLLLGSVGWIRY